MRIISYQKLMALPPVLSYKRDKLLNKNEINLNGWHNELVAIIGGQQASQAFLKKALLMGNNGVDSLTGAEAAASLEPETSIFSHIYQVISRESPYLTETKRADLTEQYLSAAYLQPYRTWTAEEVTASIWNKLLLAISFALDQKVMILPDVFAEAAGSEKAILQLAIQNLRHIQKKPRIIFFQPGQLEDAILLADRIVILEPTAAGTIGEVIPVFFYEPRNRNIIRQLPAYTALRKRLLYLLTDAFAGEDLVSFTPLESLS
jgi:ABC-type nitrate/sulfonate/bicarbonate transport system ATPase subunit